LGAFRDAAPGVGDGLQVGFCVGRHARQTRGANIGRLGVDEGHLAILVGFGRALDPQSAERLAVRKPNHRLPVFSNLSKFGGWHLFFLPENSAAPRNQAPPEAGSHSGLTSPATCSMPVFRKLSPRRGFAPRKTADAGAVPAVANSTLSTRMVLFMAPIIPESRSHMVGSRRVSLPEHLRESVAGKPVLLCDVNENLQGRDCENLL